MKKIASVLAILLFWGLLGCVPTSSRQQSVPVLDFRTEIPQKTFALEDVGNVRYLCFNAPDSVLLGEEMKLSVAGNNLFFYDPGQGDIVGFSNSGDLIFHFNRKGQGNEEYTDIRQFVYDTDRREIFIFTTGRKGIAVYGPDGSYKRLLPVPDTIMLDGMASLDRQKLILLDMKNAQFVKDGDPVKFSPDFPSPGEYPYVLFDKETAEFAPLAVLKSENRFNSFVLTMKDNRPFIYLGRQSHLFTSGRQCLISEPASDTAFALSPDLSLTPVFTRLPSVREKEGKISCSVMASTSRTMLVEAITLKYEGGDGLVRKQYLYNVPESSFSLCKFAGNDFEGYEFQNPVIADNKLYYILYPYTLLEAQKANKLHGGLQKIAEIMGEEDNPILVEVTLK